MIFEYKNGTTRDEVIKAFRPLVELQQTEAIKKAAVLTQNPAMFHTNRASLEGQDRYRYRTTFYSPLFETRTGGSAYAFQNCAAGIIQNLTDGHALSDEQFADVLAAILNNMDRDSRTWYFLPADYQVKKTRNTSEPLKNTFLWRMIHELGALEIDSTPNMFHAPSMAIMYRLCFLYNPNILKFLYCIEKVDSWEHGTHTRMHFTYYPKHRVDAKIAELESAPKDKPIDKKFEPLAQSIAAKEENLRGWGQIPAPAADMQVIWAGQPRPATRPF